MIETPATCECPIVGYCERNKREMTIRSHHLCQTRADYRRSFFLKAVGQTGEIKKPALTTQVVTLKDDSVEWIKAGRPIRTKEQQATILAICTSNKCEMHIPSQKERGCGTCKVCGCGLYAKIGMATTECPLGLWGTGDNENLHSGISG